MHVEVVYKGVRVRELATKLADEALAGAGRLGARGTRRRGELEVCGGGVLCGVRGEILHRDGAQVVDVRLPAEER